MFIEKVEISDTILGEVRADDRTMKSESFSESVLSDVSGIKV